MHTALHNAHTQYTHPHKWTFTWYSFLIMVKVYGFKFLQLLHQRTKTFDIQKAFQPWERSHFFSWWVTLHVEGVPSKSTWPLLLMAMIPYVCFFSPLLLCSRIMFSIVVWYYRVEFIPEYFYIISRTTALEALFYNQRKKFRYIFQLNYIFGKNIENFLCATTKKPLLWVWRYNFKSTGFLSNTCLGAFYASQFNFPFRLFS